MHCVKLLVKRLMAHDFDRQVAEFQVRVAVHNGYTALGIHVTKVAAQVCRATGAVRPRADLCNRAVSRKFFRSTISPAFKHHHRLRLHLLNREALICTNSYVQTPTQVFLPLVVGRLRPNL
jgi:hypothetical protein